jgi:hypothetical protein
MNHPVQKPEAEKLRASLFAAMRIVTVDSGANLNYEKAL